VAPSGIGLPQLGQNAIVLPRILNWSAGSPFTYRA